MDKRRLTWPKQWLIEQCQRLNFGQITLHIQGGEPDLGRPWRTRQTVKLAGGNHAPTNGPRNGPRPESHLDDFALCDEQVALLGQLVHVPDGANVTIEVKHGLPFLLQVDEDHLAA